MTWIKCSDEPGGMPEGADVVLATDGFQIITAFVARLDGWTQVNTWIKIPGITHFMYLPPLPGKEENDG